MNTRSQSIALQANSAQSEMCARSHVSCAITPVQAAIGDLIKSRNPLKPWGFLIDLIDIGVSAAKSRFRTGKSRRSFTVEELQALLQSEEGLDFLVAVMADATPAWWRWALKVMAIASVRRRQSEDQQLIMSLENGGAEPSARRRIKGALDADKRVSAALARAETALGYGRPDVDRGPVSQQRPVDRVQHRAVAAPARGQRR